MRVAIFAETYYPFISGVVTHIETLKNGLQALGHDVLIVTLDPKARSHYVKEGVLYCPAIQLKKIYGYGVANPVNLRRLSILREFEPDIIHLHTEFSMGIFALFAASQLKKPVVYTLHTMYDDYVFYLFPKRLQKGMGRAAKPAAHAYIRNVASKATEIIGPSRKVADYLHRCGVTRHINIVPNTVDLSDFLPQNVDADMVRQRKKELGIRASDVALCFVGRLGKEKSIDVMIDYFAQSFLGDDSYKLFVIGDGPEREGLQQLIDQRGVSGQVKLLGRIEHELLPAYYRAFDLFTTASITEMNSISLLEATASSLYAVNRLDVYNRDQIKTGENGEVYDNAAAFGEIVRRYAALDAKAKKQKKEAVTAYATRYGPREFTQKIMNVYEIACDRFERKSRA